MSNAYTRTFASYLQRSLSSWALALFTICGLLQALVTILSRGRDIASGLMFFLTGELFMGALLWIHFREQVVHPYRQLLPHYSRPQLTAFAIYSAGLVIAWPFALGAINHVSVLSLTAIGLLGYALLGFALLTMSTRLIPIGLAAAALCVWATFASVGGDAWNFKRFIAGSNPTFCFIIAAIGLVGIIAVTIRMLTLTPDHDWYHRGPQVDAWSTRPRMTGEVNRSWQQAEKSKLFGWPAPDTAPFIPASNSIWQRSGRWRALNKGVFKFTFFMMTLVLLATWFPEKFINDPVKIGPLILCIYLSLMPVAVSAQSEIRHWRFLEIELLRPVHRAVFLREIGLAIAVSFFQCWAIFAVGFIISMTLLASEAIDISAIVRTLIGSFLLQIFFFAVVVWLLRYRSSILLLALAMPAAIIGALPTFSLAIPQGAFGMSHPIAIMIAAILAPLGLLVARDAARRWLITELG